MCSAGHLALEHLVDRDAGPFGNDLGDVFLRHLLAQERPVLLQLLELGGLRGGALLELRDPPVPQLRGAIQIASALRQLGVGLRRLHLLLQLAELANQLLLVLPHRLHLIDALAQLGDLGCHLASRFADASSFSLPSACFSIASDVSWRSS